MDKQKIKATLLYILQQLGGQSDFIKIFKVLYFATQKHLVRYGRAIVEDDFIAMPKGPVPSWLYNAVQKENKSCASYSVVASSITHSSTRHFIISSSEAPDMGMLSASDVECLSESIKENASLSASQLSIKSHDSAWKKREGRTMTYVEIAQAGGANEATLEYIAEDLELNEMLLCHQ